MKQRSFDVLTLCITIQLNIKYNSPIFILIHVFFCERPSDMQSNQNELLLPSTSETHSGKKIKHTNPRETSLNRNISENHKYDVIFLLPLSLKCWGGGMEESFYKFSFQFNF